MQKRRLITLSIALLLLLLCSYGCDNAKKSESVVPEAPIITEAHATVHVTINTLVPNDGRLIVVSQGNRFSHDLEIIEVEVVNHINDSILVENTYYFEEYKNGAWIGVPLTLTFQGPGLPSISPGSSCTTLCDLHLKSYNWPTGEYRIVKEFRVNNKTYKMSIEFELCE